MSNLKFLFFFELIPVRRQVCFMCSLKLANQSFSLLTLALLSMSLFIEVKYSEENIFYKLTKYLVFSLLNIIASYYIFKSSSELNYKQAYIGHLLLFWSFVVHLFLFSINTIFNVKFFPLIALLDNKYGSDSYNKYILTVLFPQMCYIIFEFFFLWICFLYTKNLSMGKDALVDGQTFDRYIENLASSENSRKSSPRNSSLGIPLESFDQSFTLNQSQEVGRREMLNADNKV